jgi:hypothetical protein
VYEIHGFNPLMNWDGIRSKLNEWEARGEDFFWSVRNFYIFDVIYVFIIIRLSLTSYYPFYVNN